MRKRNNGFLLAFPALAGFLVFYFVPFLITVWYSVSFGIGKREFVGLDNFKSLFENEMFLLAVKNTIQYMAVTVPVTLVGAMFLSILLQNAVKGVRFFQLSFLYPMILPIASVVLGVQFLWGESGIWNRVLELIGGEPKDWLNTSAAFWVLCILYCWRFTGYYVLIYFARLQMIPREYYEYATMFGAGKWQSFWHITWPMLIATFGFTIVLSVMNGFKCYREAFLLGGNYPDDSIYLLQHFMNNNFQNLNYQKISAAAVSIVAALLVPAVVGYVLYLIVRRGKKYG